MGAHVDEHDRERTSESSGIRQERVFGLHVAWCPALSALRLPQASCDRPQASSAQIRREEIVLVRPGVWTTGNSFEHGGLRASIWSVSCSGFQEEAVFGFGALVGSIALPFVVGSSASSTVASARVPEPPLRRAVLGASAFQPLAKHSPSDSLAPRTAFTGPTMSDLFHPLPIQGSCGCPDGQTQLSQRRLPHALEFPKPSTSGLKTRWREGVHGAEKFSTSGQWRCCLQSWTLREQGLNVSPRQTALTLSVVFDSLGTVSRHVSSGSEV